MISVRSSVLGICVTKICNEYLRSHVLTKVNVSTVVLWVVITCSFARSLICLGGGCFNPEDGGAAFLRNNGNQFQDDPLSQPTTK
jgi:hypothetical protein